MQRLKIILQSKYTYYFLFIFLLFYVLIFTYFIHYESKITNYEKFTGIVKEVDISKDKLTFILDSSELIKCNYYGKDYLDYKDILGNLVTISGEVTDLKNNTIPNTFNYKKYLYNNKIYNVISVNNIEVLKSDNIFYKIKKILTNKMNTDNELVTTYLNLFILGNKSTLDENIYNSYQSNGIWHLFAISGTHISLIVLVLDKLLKKFKFKNIFIYLILFYFMFLTDFASSVMRATIYYYLSTILKKYNVLIPSQNILLLCAFIILVVNPFYIYDVGFQYSFLISLSLMLEKDNIKGSYIRKLFKISLISFIVSLPITINLNYEVNILSILLNIFYVPFITFIVFPISILTLFLSFLSPIFIFLINILEVSNQFISKLNTIIIIPKIPIILIIFYYLSLLLYKLYRKKYYLIILVFIIILNIFLPKFDKSTYIYYLDVSQGDSSIIISPKQKDVIMIDTGGIFYSNYKVSDNSVKFLKSLGISHIDYLILTHGDYDHLGDSSNVIDNIKVKNVIFNCGNFNDLESSLIKELDSKKIKYYSCINELNINNTKLNFLNNFDYNNENDNSIILYTKIDNYEFLFMGDAGVEVEKNLIEKYNIQDIDVLKVGHHGSKTSSSKEFIDIINPKYSIISVGKNNFYGHPHKDVLSILKNSIIYRTDKDGSIMFKIKNNKLGIVNYSS